MTNTVNMVNTHSLNLRERTTEPLITVARTEQGVRVEGKESGVVGSKETGFFLSWKWTGKKLIVRSHPKGFYPAFYSADKNSISLALRPQDLYPQCGPFVLDTISFWTFLITGVYLNNRTALSGIRAIPEGGELQWSPGEETYEAARPAPQASSTLSYTQLLDGYIDLFRTAIAIYPNTPSRLPLSGGRDSRHILFELSRQGRLPNEAVTVKSFPPKNSGDDQVAAILCKQVGTPHRVLGQTKNVVERAVETHEFNGLAFLEGAWKAELRDACRGYRSIVWDGIAGDVLSAGLRLSTRVCEQAYSTPYNLTDALYPNLVQNYNDLSALGLRPSVPVEDIREYLANSIAQYQNDHAPPTSFVLWNRTRRQIAANTVGCFNEAMVAAPFLNAELFDFLTSIPMPINASRNLHTDAISRAYPRYSDIPYSENSVTRIPLETRIASAKSLISLVRQSRLPRPCKNIVLKRAARMVCASHGWRWDRLHVPEVTYAARAMALAEKAGH